MDETVYYPKNFEQQFLTNPPVEGLPDEISVESDDWNDFLDGFDRKYQNDIWNQLSTDYSNEEVLIPEFNYEGYQKAVSDYSEDSDNDNDSFYDRLPDTIEYGDPYDKGDNDDI